MKFHEASKLFPLLLGAEFDSFAADIKENGLQNPIKTFHGEILDGRNRYRACKEVGVKPLYEEVTPDDPVSYVLSLNLHHRHLNESQRAMVAAKVREHYAEKAKERQRASPGRPASKKVATNDATFSPPRQAGQRGRSSDDAGATMGVSGMSVDRARVVQEKGVPELVAEVEAGRMSVSKAAKIASLPAEDQTKTLNGEKVKPPAKGSNGCPVKGHEKTEQYAMECARVAITQLARIKPNNPGRDEAFTKVEKWITAQRDNK